MKRLLIMGLALLLLGAAPPDEELRGTALRWLARVDAEDKGFIYNGLTESVKSEKSRAAVLNQLREARSRFGEAKFHRATEIVHGQGYVLVRVQSSFEDGVKAQENVWLSPDPDQSWKISGYELISQGVSVTRLGATP